MKTLILMTATLLTLAFGNPVLAQGAKDVRGYVFATESYQVIDGTLVVNATGSGHYTFGKFTITYHGEVDLTTGFANGTAIFKAPNGDTHG